MSTLQTQLVKKTAIIDSRDFNLSAARYLEKVEINSEFEIKRLGEIIDIVKDKPENFDGSKKYFSTGNVSNDHIGDKFQLVEFNNKPSRANILPKKGDVGFAKMKSTNKVVIIDDLLEGSIFSTGFCFIRSRECVNPNYLYHLIKNKRFQDNKNELTSDGIMGAIRQNDILNIEVPLPPLETQEQIVKEVEGYQQIIDGCRKVVENYNPVIDIDPSWEKFELKKFISVKNGHAFKSKLFQKNGIQIIRMSNIKMNLFEPHIKPVFYDEKNKDKFLKYVIKKGDILISMTGTQGKRDYGYVCIVNNDSDYLLNQRIGKIELFNDKINKMFLYIIMSQKFFQDQVFKKSTGVRQANISSKSLEEIQIPLPSKKDQEIIVEKLEQERKVIEGNKELIKIYEKKINDKIKELF